MFTAGDRVVKVIVGAGVKTASLHTVKRVEDNKVFLVDNDFLMWNNKTGREIDAIIPGFYSEIIMLEE